jgi:hypothetical protein
MPAMTRRPDPLRIYAARRAGLLTRLQAEGRISEYTAEVWITAWEAEACLRGLDGRTTAWWDPAWNWLAERRQIG